MLADDLARLVRGGQQRPRGAGQTGPRWPRLCRPWQIGAVRATIALAENRCRKVRAARFRHRLSDAVAVGLRRPSLQPAPACRPGFPPAAAAPVPPARAACAGGADAVLQGQGPASPGMPVRWSAPIRARPTGPLLPGRGPVPARGALQGVSRRFLPAWPRRRGPPWAHAHALPVEPVPRFPWQGLPRLPALLQQTQMLRWLRVWLLPVRQRP